MNLFQVKTTHSKSFASGYETFRCDARVNLQFREFEFFLTQARITIVHFQISKSRPVIITRDSKLQLLLVSSSFHENVRSISLQREYKGSETKIDEMNDQRRGAANFSTGPVLTSSRRLRLPRHEQNACSLMQPGSRWPGTLRLA